MSVIASGVAFYLLAFILALIQHFIPKLRKPAIVSLLIGLILYFIHIGKLSFSLKGFPFADTYGFYSLLGNSLVAVTTLLSFRFVYLQRFLAFFAFLGILSTLLSLPAERSPYRSPLYSLHITSALFSYGFAIAGGFFSLLKFIVENKLKHKSLKGFFAPLFFLREGERLSINLSFVFLTLTLVFGSFWSRSFFGKHWIDDPKLVSVLILWLYYSLLVHLNILKKLRPKNLSYGVMAGTVFTLINMLFIRHEM